MKIIMAPILFSAIFIIGCKRASSSIPIPVRSDVIQGELITQRFCLESNYVDYNFASNISEPARPFDNEEHPVKVSIFVLPPGDMTLIDDRWRIDPSKQKTQQCEPIK